jgi:hypothetical protein
MSAPTSISCIAFDGDRCIGTGGLREMAGLAKAALDRGGVPIVMFDATTSHRVEIDLRGSLDDILARLPAAVEAAEAPTAAVEPPRGPGRPKLGVVAREVTLLPRHWEWLAQQRGGASVALRRLVDAARRANSDSDRIQQAQESAYRFVAVMAASHADYEEALRALFARDAAKFEQRTATWPADVRDHARRLAAAAFAPAPTEAVAG